VLKEANQYKFQDDVSTEEEDQEAKEQLTLQIHNSLVTIDQGQPESPEQTREPWAPDRMPTIASATTTIPTTTYPTQQTQLQLPMATDISKKEHSLPCLTGFLPCRCLATSIVSTFKVIKGRNFCKTYQNL
jgi:hypothetical protein